MTKAKAKKTPAKKANGKTTSKTAKVLALRRRRTGCTCERLTATEWPSISMQAVAKAAGVKLRVDKKERPYRYRAAQPCSASSKAAQTTTRPTRLANSFAVSASSG